MNSYLTPSRVYAKGIGDAVAGIYLIRHINSGKGYIGSSVNLRRRFCQHANKLIANNHPNQKLQRAWNKYGKLAFSFEAVEVVTDKKDLIKREQYWLDTEKPFYNICPKADSSLGLIRSAKTRALISKANRNRSPETLAKMSESHKGKTLSAETREKVRQANLCRSPKVYERMVESSRGRKHSVASRLKMAAAQSGKVISEEQKLKIATALTGRKASPETREKMRQSRARYLQSQTSKEAS